MTAKNAKKNSKAAEYRELSSSDLQLKLHSVREELLNLRIQQATGQVENPVRLRVLRRQVARLNTVAAEKTK
ncbi:MAG: 50S ribosomal protein L29 [Puniceicoccales bacterium]|nr:50S ribosomal protein L29 [Puniceicoccales bacterium]